MVQAMSPSQDTTPSPPRCSAGWWKEHRYGLALKKSARRGLEQETTGCKSRAVVIVRPSRSPLEARLPASHSKGERCVRDFSLRRRAPLTRACNLQDAAD